MDNTVPIPEEAFPSPHGTVSIGSDIPIDTEMRRFTEKVPREPFPSKRRTMRLHIPQEVEPIVLIDVESLIVGRAKGENRLDLSMQYAKMLGVSREHAKIELLESNYYITDLGSTNGTYLNNKKLTPKKQHRIEHSDQIRFGHFVAILGFS